MAHHRLIDPALTRFQPSKLLGVAEHSFHALPAALALHRRRPVSADGVAHQVLIAVHACTMPQSVPMNPFYVSTIVALLLDGLDIAYVVVFRWRWSMRRVEVPTVGSGGKENDTKVTPYPACRSPGVGNRLMIRMYFEVVQTPPPAIGTMTIELAYYAMVRTA